MINWKPCSRKGMGDGPGKRESKSCMCPDLSKLLSHFKFYLRPLRSQIFTSFLGKKKESRWLKLFRIKSLSCTFSLFSILASVAYTILGPVHSQGKQRPLARSSRKESPGMTFPSNSISLLMPSDLYLQPRSELQSCTSRGFHARFPELPAYP